MRWEDERYVRVYTRNTGEWLALSWEARALFVFLLRVADRAGLVHTGKAGIRGLAGLAGMPADVVERVAPELLADGCLRASEGGYIIPNFIAAQEAKASDAQRKRDQRERDRDKAIASGSSGSRAGMDAEAGMRSQHSVTQDSHAMASQAVTPSHAGEVTPSLAMPNRAVPDTASQGSADAGQQPGERPPLTLTTQDANPQPKQRAPRKPSDAELLYQQVQEVRRQQCEKAGVPFTPDYMPEARQNKELGPVVRVPPGAEVDEKGRTEAFRRFTDAFAEYLSDDFHRAKGWPLALFLTGTVRARYEQAAALTAQASLAEAS